MIFNQRKVDPETRKLVLDLLRYQLDLGIRNRDSIFERLATLIALLRVLASLVGVIVTADVFPGFARDWYALFLAGISSLAGSLVVSLVGVALVARQTRVTEMIGPDVLSGAVMEAGLDISQAEYLIVGLFEPIVVGNQELVGNLRTSLILVVSLAGVA